MSFKVKKEITLDGNKAIFICRYSKLRSLYTIKVYDDDDGMRSDSFLKVYFLVVRVCSTCWNEDNNFLAIKNDLKIEGQPFFLFYLNLKWFISCFSSNFYLFIFEQDNCVTDIIGRGSERRRSERRQAKNFRTSKWSF